MSRTPWIAAALLAACEPTEEAVLLCEPGPAVAVTERVAGASLVFTAEAPGWSFGPLTADGGRVAAVLAGPGGEARVVRWTDAAPLLLLVAELPAAGYRMTTITAGADVYYVQGVDADPGTAPALAAALFEVRAGMVVQRMAAVRGREPVLVHEEGLIVQLVGGEFVLYRLASESDKVIVDGDGAALAGDTLIIYRSGPLHDRIDRVPVYGGPVEPVSPRVCIDGVEERSESGPAVAVAATGPVLNSGRSIAGFDAQGERRELVRIAGHEELRGLTVVGESMYFLGETAEEIAVFRAPLAGGSAEALARFARADGETTVRGWAVSEAAVYVALERPGAPGEVWKVAR